MVFVSTAPVSRPLGSPPFGLKRAHCHARRNLACAHLPNEASPKRRREVLELTAAVIGSSFLRPGQSVASDDTALRCFLDLSFNGQAQGRIVIELTDGLVSTGCRRFYDLAVGVEGVDYRRSKFDAIFPVRVPCSHLVGRQRV